MLVRCIALLGPLLFLYSCFNLSSQEPVPASIDSKNQKTFSKSSKYAVTYSEVSKNFNGLKTQYIDLGEINWVNKKKRKEMFNSLSQLKSNEFFTLKWVTNPSVKKRTLKTGFLSDSLTNKNDLYISVKHYNLQGIPFIDFLISKYDIEQKRIKNLNSSGVIYIPKINIAKFFFPLVKIQNQENRCLQSVQYFLSEFNRTRKRIYAKKDQQLYKDFNLNRIEISNNCREPGSFEIGLFSEKASTQEISKIGYGYIHYPYPLFKKLIKSWSGRFPHEMGVTELRLALPRYENAHSLDLKNYHYFTFNIEGAGKKEVPHCSIRNINDETYGENVLVDKSSYLDGKTFKYINGTIPFSDLPKETQKKSAFKRLDRNSYLFIKMNKTIKEAPPSFLKRGDQNYPLPVGFFEVVDGKWKQHETKNSFLQNAKNGREFWETAYKHPYDIYVPHRFGTYEEMYGAYSSSSKKLVGGYWDAKEWNILPSSFEVDGRYGAELSIKHFNAPRVWAIDLGFIQNLNFHESSIHLSKREQVPVFSTDLKCLNNCQGKVQNIAIRNVKLNPGERKEILLGIGVEPLEVDYIRNSEIKDLVYAVTYDKDGKITDHNPEVGKIVVTRGKVLGGHLSPDIYTIDIITDDRIHPLARYQIDMSSRKRESKKEKKER